MNFYQFLNERNLLHMLEFPEELPRLREEYRVYYKKMYAKEYAKKRVHRIIIFTPEEYARLKVASDNHGKPFSRFVRESALAYTSNGYILPDPTETKAVLVALKRYGVNLNQISHLCNSIQSVRSTEIIKVQNNFNRLAKDIKRIYTKPIQIEDFVLDVVQKNPNYVPKIYHVLENIKQ